MDYTAEFRYNSEKDEYYIYIPPELQETLEWQEGDILDYTFESDKLIIENISL
jgi:bifunctional DNA-binding transcriptional regulator/antitoxin component of YhaV-PrlF toxin-antitoxin module